MATNAYLDRMQQLDRKKEEKLAREANLPLQRPLNKQPSGLAGNPLPQQEEDDTGMDNPFGMNVQALQSQDSRFDSMMQEFTKLATGLGDTVRQGYMPEVIARQRLMTYLQDSGKYFAQNKATPMDNPQVAGMIEQALMQASQQGGAESAQDPNAPQGAPQGGMPPQGAQQLTPKEGIAQ